MQLSGQSGLFGVYLRAMESGAGLRASFICRGGVGCSFECAYDLRLRDIWSSSSADVMRWWLAHGLGGPDSVICNHCGRAMKLVSRKSRSKKRPGASQASFQCKSRHCGLGRASRRGGAGAEHVAPYIDRDKRLDQQTSFVILFMAANGYTREQISKECKIHPDTATDYMSYALEVISVFNRLDYVNSKASIVDGQFDETVVSKRKKGKGKRVRAGGVAWLATATSLDPQGRAVKFFCSNIPDRSGPVLKAPILHLAAEGARVATDKHASYRGLAKVRPDLRHGVVNHSDKNNRRVAPDGAHTNVIEALHGGLKRNLRRQFWQVSCKGGEIGAHKIQFCAFVGNCKRAARRVTEGLKIADGHMSESDSSQLLGATRISPLVEWLRISKIFHHEGARGFEGGGPWFTDAPKSEALADLDG